MTFSRRLAQHESLELIVVDPAGSVLVDFSDHLVQVSIRQIVVEFHENLLDDVGVDFAFSILVQDTESFFHLDFILGLLGLGPHKLEELVNVDGTTAVGVDDLDALFQLVVLQVVSQHAHDSAQLGSRDLTSAGGIELLESILEVSNLIIGELEGIFLLLLLVDFLFFRRI